jgi:hypothetical protein
LVDISNYNQNRCPKNNKSVEKIEKGTPEIETILLSPKLGNRNPAALKTTPNSAAIYT